MLNVAQNFERAFELYEEVEAQFSVKLEKKGNENHDLSGWSSS